jgi:REP element-mobilizing transposase RayT
MSVRLTHQDRYGTFFITFTCHDWLHLFAKTNGYFLVYKWFDHLREKGNYINGFVIMPNHLHVLVTYRNSRQTVNTRVGNGKRFIAYGLVDLLEGQGQTDLLIQLAAVVSKSDLRKGKKHQVFEPSFDCKYCISEQMILEKLAYIHANPCKGKWKLVNDPADYIHSSARFYMQGVGDDRYPVTDYREMEGLDLENSALLL